MILLTGGSGTLGTELQKIMPGLFWAPSRRELDVTSTVALPKGVELVLHAAAYTDVAAAEYAPWQCYRTNVYGTYNMASLGLPLAYISTEYVFNGEKGLYDTGDAVGPVNTYAASKFCGEIEARKAPASLVLRCIFKPNPFPHESVVTDQWTSGDYVEEIAPQVLSEVLAWDRTGHITRHLGTGRKNVFDLASQTRECIPIKRKDINVRLPRDTSLRLS